MVLLEEKLKTHFLDEIENKRHFTIKKMVQSLVIKYIL